MRCLPRTTRSVRAGFTLIELLVVVAIIGILAAIALPKFSNSRNRANLAAVKSDLKSLITAEENYFDDNGAYAGDVADLRYSSSRGVSVTIDEATGAGFMATATHTALGGMTCTIWVGRVTTPVGNEGVPSCS